MASKFYAVKTGRNPGIYHTWEECRKQILGFSGARYKSFATMEEAEAFIKPGENEMMEVDEDTLTAYVDGSFCKDNETFLTEWSLCKNSRMIFILPENMKTRILPP